MFDEFRDNLHYRMSGDCKADTVCSIDPSSIDAKNTTIDVDERPTRVAMVDGCISLQHIFQKPAITLGKPTVEPAHYTHAYGVCKLAQWCANGETQFSNLR